MTAKAIVELHGIGRTYPGSETVRALDDVSLSIYQGDFLTITGSSGSGKSTLLNIVGLLDQPTQGEYYLEGRAVGELPDRTRSWLRSERIGLVFQGLHLMDRRSCLENAALGGLYRGWRRSAANRRARLALEQVGLGSRLDSFPIRMSGGERQRVAIARALAMDPALLVCDEPTGNLDSANTEAILGLLDGLNQSGVTVMLVTHEADVASRGNRSVRLLDGRVVEQS